MKKVPIILSALLVIAAAALTVTYESGNLASIHPLKKPKTDQRRVACVGDSITYGCGVKHWSKNAYPAVLGRLLGKDDCVINFGYSARTASLKGDYPYENDDLYRQSLDFQPDVVVLMLGTNDSKPYNWQGAQSYTEDCRRLIRAYQDLPSHPQIFLVTPPPAWSLNGKPVQYDISAQVIEQEIRPALIALAQEEELPLIDVFSVFSGHPELFPDGVHPNAEGARLLAETVYEAIRTKG